MLINNSIVLIILVLNTPLLLWAKKKLYSVTDQEEQPDAQKTIPRTSPSLHDVAKQLIITDNEERDYTAQKIQKTIEGADQALQKITAEMAAQYSNHADRIRAETEQKTQILLQQANTKSASLLHEAHGHIMQLKRQAAKQIEQLIAQAEEESLKKRKKRRKEVLEDSLHALDEGQAWKIAFKKDFYEAIEYVESIIASHEEPAQIAEFTRLFNEQKIWFENTLAKTNNAQDPAYFVLTQKALFFRNLVIGYQQAETQLKKVLPERDHTSIAFTRLRLMIFYELNALLQERAAENPSLNGPALSEREIKHIVTQMLYKARSEKHIADYLHELASKETALRTELASTKETLKTAAQEAVRKTQESFVPRLEAATKENFELQTIILDTKAHLEKATTQAADVKATLQKTQAEAAQLRTQITQHKQQSSEFEAKVYILEEFNKKLMEEEAAQFDLKKTLQNEIVTQPTINKQDNPLQIETQPAPPKPVAALNYVQAESEARMLLEAELTSRIQTQDIK